MQAEDKNMAEGVLRHLCQGAQIDGIRFGPILQVLISHHGLGQPKIQGQIYLNLGSAWTVFEANPFAYPDQETDLPELSVEQQLVMLCSMRERVITEINLGTDYPHLIITLDNGRVFFINGRHEQYECWQLGAAFGNPKECWMVVALPGDSGIAVWAPESMEGATGNLAGNTRA